MTFDMDAFSTVVQIRAALRQGQISARELLDLHLRRIDRLDGAIHSVIFRRDEEARREADAADAAKARGEDLPLQGVPITVKESIDLTGTPSSAGVVARAAHRAATDARTVQKLKAAGAVIIGKTNVCPFLADYIADNPIYGRTLSPWDPSLTPGGSSGGSATVAAGLCALDLGSDLGGSIRIPAAFCGLFGHKPSEGAVPYSGHFPGSVGVNPAWVMTAQGPITRSAADLDLTLDVLVGPDVGIDTAWHIALPPARHDRLRDFRVAMLPWQPWLPVDSEIIAAMEALAQKLRDAGVTVIVVSPPGLGDLKEFHGVCRSMMSALVSARWPAEHRQRVVADRRQRQDFSDQADIRGFTATAADFLLLHERREQYRQGYRDFFKSYDVLLTPMSLVPPFPHPTQPVADRIFHIGGRDIGFDYLSFYPGVASLPGHGATAFPLGFTKAQDKNLHREQIYKDIEESVASGLRKQFNAEDAGEFTVHLDRSNGAISAQRRGVDVPLSVVSRIGAQTVKQVIIQLIRQNERGGIFGLPLGAQAIGPFLEDRTPIRFAQLIEREFGGFKKPPGWDSTLG